MNKLQGFYELRKMDIPAVSWRPFTGTETLDANLLWTVRVAVCRGNDFNLPRAVGVSAEEAMGKGKELLVKLAPEDLVVYYPYFMALKSGIIEIQDNQTIIEAVDKDLWNLTTLGHKDLTIIKNRQTGEISTFGNPAFLNDSETAELMYYADKVRAILRRYLFNNSSVLLEWHYAGHTDIKREPIGDPYLVFTECKSRGGKEPD
jgi:hypothetical protein